MLLKCINNDLCSTLTLNKEYYVLEETSDYYVVIDLMSKTKLLVKNQDLKLLR